MYLLSRKNTTNFLKTLRSANQMADAVLLLFIKSTVLLYTNKSKKTDSFDKNTQKKTT